MPAEVSDNIPGVDNQQFASVAGLLPELPNIRAEPADRFAQAVRTLVEKRARRAWPNEGDADLAVFVMVDRPRQVGQDHGARPFLDPLAQDDPVLGHLFFANGDASRGHVMSIPTKANAIVDWIDDHGLGSCPIVTVYRKSKQMFTRRAGVNDNARDDPIRDEEPTATLSELNKALKHFHERRLITPACCPKGVWERGCANRYVPGPHPESSIHYPLDIAIDSWFHGVLKTDSEAKTTIGRIDLRLLKKKKQDESFAYWISMELKVIKSFTNAPKDSEPSPVKESDNVDAIVEGVKQAAAYRENCSAEEALLEVYDLRKDKTDDLTKRAKVLATKKQFTPQPRIYVWPVFGSARHARNAGYTGG